MLVVSALLLPCGLLALASAQGDPPAFSPQLTDALAQGLLQEGLLTRLQTGDLPTLLDYFFKHRLNLWAKPIHPHRDDRDAEVLLQEPRLLQLSLDRKPGSREVTLTIPLAFTMIVNFLILDTITTEIRSDIHVQLALEKSSDGRDRLTSKDCSVSPEAVRIQTEFFVLPPKLRDHHLAMRIESFAKRALRHLIARNLEETMCPLINSWLYNLDQRLVNEISTVLREDSSQDSSAGAADEGAPSVLHW